LKLKIIAGVAAAGAFYRAPFNFTRRAGKQIDTPTTFGKYLQSRITV
jgi:hypothetical protein